MALTPKQDKFAMLVANGSSYCDAYRQSYDAKNMLDDTIYKESSTLMANPLITGRVDQIKQQSLQHMRYDMEAHYRELDEIRKLALVPRGDNGKLDLAAASKVTELKGRLKGHYEKDNKQSSGQGVLGKVLRELLKNHE